MSIKGVVKGKSLKKSQVFGSDFIMSAALFLIILFASVELWNMTAAKYSNHGSNELMQKKAFSITDTLIKTEGFPKNWNNETVKIIGVSEKTPQVLDRIKLLDMKNISYSNMKKLWGVSDFNVHITFMNSTGETISINGVSLEYGQKPSNQKDLVPLKRLVLINDSGTLIRSVMTFIIWR